MPSDINACELFIGLKDLQRGGTGMLFASVRQGFKSTFPRCLAQPVVAPIPAKLITGLMCHRTGLLPQRFGLVACRNHKAKTSVRFSALGHGVQGDGKCQAVIAAGKGE